MFSYSQPTNRLITLSDHIATLRAYLNDYRMTENDEDRARMSSQFSDYITAACWEKMYHRMTHWATLGFIKILADMSDGAIESAALAQPRPNMTQVLPNV